MPEKTANNRNYPAKLLSREARSAVHVSVNQDYNLTLFFILSGSVTIHEIFISWLQDASEDAEYEFHG